MFKITIRKGMFGSSVSGLGNVEYFDGHVNVRVTIRGKPICFFVQMGPAALLRSLERGGKVFHMENDLWYTFTPVYA